MIAALIFATDFLFGYTLQAFGCALAIHAFNKRQIEAKGFWLMVLLFSVATLLIRKTAMFNFGFHTILVVVSCILITILVFRFPIYNTVLAMLISIISIMAFEMLNYVMMTFFLGKGRIADIMAATKNTPEHLVKTLIGIPTNIFLVIAMGLAYLLMRRRTHGRTLLTTSSNWVLSKKEEGNSSEMGDRGGKDR